jgi:rhodanese-related sulfurtransferase
MSSSFRPPRSTAPLSLLVLLTLLTGCGGDGPGAGASSGPAVSGHIDDGRRVLTFDAAASDQRHTVYRGDYVRPQLASGGRFRLTIPALGVDREFPAAAGERPYFKVPEAGLFEFRLGDGSGVIEAIPYEAVQYREVTAREAATLLDDRELFVLDVRTSREFAAGHIAGAELVPIHTLQRRMTELAARSDEPVLVYCRTGNRSTVAAKLLIDAGFGQVINLRRGIVEWQREGLPLAR